MTLSRFDLSCRVVAARVPGSTDRRLPGRGLPRREKHHGKDLSLEPSAVERVLLQLTLIAPA